MDGGAGVSESPFRVDLRSVGDEVVAFVLVPTSTTRSGWTEAGGWSRAGDGLADYFGGESETWTAVFADAAFREVGL